MSFQLLYNGQRPLPTIFFKGNQLNYFQFKKNYAILLVPFNLPIDKYQHPLQWW